MAVVSNSSPLILYAKLGSLDLLRAVFTEIIVPEAVYSEVVTVELDRQGSRPGAIEVTTALQESWIARTALTRRETIDVLLAVLDRGEAEAIALGEERGVPILLDDRLGRRLARERGVRVFGSAGVLALAKRQGAIPLVRPMLDELRAAGLYLSASVYYELLAIAGE